MAYEIFICYRRANKELARSIQDRLAAEFGSDAVFMDIDSISGGHDWEERVVEILNDKPVVVTLITTIWNSRRGGKPRLLHEHDHVRFELRSALERELIIIPVLYDPANWPTEKHLPSELQPILRFQHVRMSQDRWDYDVRELIKALKDVLGKPSEVTSPSPPTPTAPRSAMGIGQPILPGRYSPSMFRESPKQRAQRVKEQQERWEADEKRRAEAQAREPPFFARWEFWAATLLTLILGVGAFAGAEFLAAGAASLVFRLTDQWQWFANGTLPDPSVAAAVLLVGFWALARVALGAAAYWYDPEDGAKVFFTRGIFGGYTLFFEDIEPVGIWAAWPIATIVAWVPARIAAWFTGAFLGWNYSLIFWIVLGLITIPVFIYYVLCAADETL